MNFFPQGIRWSGPSTIHNKSFRCGFCGDSVSSTLGHKAVDGNGSLRGGIYICPGCQGPTFFTPEWRQIPSPSLGKTVPNLPSIIEAVYEEARSCVTIGSYTAAVLLCRKLLMNIAVSQGAKAGRSFMEYVEYLSDAGYIPPNGKHWVDHIRKKGNEATHEINVMGFKDAEDLLVFSEMLLRFIYEFPNLVDPPKAEN